ncbi:MAG: hypothetical protein NC929_03465, partial [Candidatus Omnitrophica bacterium]|nr:hypothetical protein [Candidatus Omnitrophota bacterium]
TAGEWINTNISSGASIGLKEYPVAFRTPPFSFAKYKISVIDDITKYKGNLPDYFITGSFDWRFSSYEEMKDCLSDYYEEFKVFNKVPHIFNIKFDIKSQRLPPDYCYFNPTIIIWKVKQNLNIYNY